MFLRVASSRSLTLLIAFVLYFERGMTLPFIPPQVHLVDYTPSKSGLTNFLFRGNMPKNPSLRTFAMDALEEQVYIYIYIVFSWSPVLGLLYCYIFVWNSIA